RFRESVADAGWMPFCSRIEYLFEMAATPSSSPFSSKCFNLTAVQYLCRTSSCQTKQYCTRQVWWAWQPSPRNTMKKGCEVKDIPELSEYALEPLRRDEEFILYRGHPRQAEGPSVLLLAPVSTHPAPETLKKIDHEYSFREELDPTWAV